MSQDFSHSLILCALLTAACQSNERDKSEDTDPLPTSGELSVLTYNVHGLPGAITGDDTAGRMSQISERITTHDIVGLQEDFDAENHATLVGSSTHTTGLWFDDKLEDRFYGSGLSVLAEAPLVEHIHQHFTSCNGTIDSASDCLASKGFQALRVRIGGATLDVYNTHLEAGGSAADNDARAAQVQALVDSLQGWSTDQAVIFTGDFNLRETDPEDLPLIEQLLIEAELERACWAVECATPNHIDKILFRSSDSIALSASEWSNIEADFRDTEGTPLSDHPAIEAIFEWSSD